jgi:hypothetical protein
MERPMDRRKCEVDVSLRASFWEDERGQDMVEYSLLLAFVCLSVQASLSAWDKPRALYGAS